MIKMSEDTRKFIQENLPEVDLETIEINDLLMMLDDLMLDSLTKDYNPTEKTRVIDRVYDEIYCCN